MNNIFLKTNQGKIPFFPQKKIFKTSFPTKEKLYTYTLLAVFLISFFPQKGITQCIGSANCIAGVNISVDTDCELTVHPAQFLSNYQSLSASCTNSLYVYITDENDNFIAQGAQVTLNFGNLVLGASDSISRRRN